MNTIEVKNLTMRFKDITALDSVNITIADNKIYGLLGRNGAGKSTLLNLITSKLFPSGGEIRINGENVSENDRAMSKIYCMTEKTLIPEGMKVLQGLKWTKEFYPGFDMDYALGLADKFKLNLKTQIKKLSTGYLSIYKIICAMASNAEIILLDEPVLGLDANHRDIFYKELINSYMNNPRIIIISTHLIEEVSDLIEEAIVIHDGKILVNEQVEKLLQSGYSVSGKASDVESFIKDKNIMGTESLGGLKTAYIFGDLDKNLLPESLEYGRLSLQKLFIELTNKQGGEK